MSGLGLYFKKYWIKHKKQGIILLLSVILCVTSVCFPALMERTESRRHLHEILNLYGNYNYTVIDVTDENIKELSKKPSVEKTGRVSVCEYAEFDENRFAIGYCQDVCTEKLAHIPFLKGDYPKSNGEIAIPQMFLTGEYKDAEIGDDIQLYLVGQGKTEKFTICGVIDSKTSRRDFNYQYLQSEGIKMNDLEYPSPCIFISKDDQRFSQLYQNLYVLFPDSLYSETKKNNGSDDRNIFIDSAENIGLSIIPGGGHNRLAKAIGKQDSDGNLTFEIDDDARFNSFISVLMLFISAISLFSSVSSFYPERVRSFRLLNQIGVSVRKLQKLILMELFTLIILGLFGGVFFSILLHELSLLVQRSLGLAMCHGYIAEWIVRQQTLNPFFISILICLLVVSVTSIPFVIKIRKLQNEKASKLHLNTLLISRFVFSKIIGGAFSNIMHSLSITIVLFSTILTFLYTTNQDKGGSVLTYGRPETESEEYKRFGVDMLTNAIDAVISVPPVATNGFGVDELRTAMDADFERNISSFGEVYAWGAYPCAMTIWYSENPQNPKLEPFKVELNDIWEYYDDFSDQYFYDIPIVFFNDTMMQEIGAKSNSKCILVKRDSPEVYSIGDIVPLVTARYDFSKSHIKIETMKKIPVYIDDLIRYNPSIFDDSPFLNALKDIFGKQTLIMSCEYAEQIGLYSPTYTTIMLKADSVHSDNIIDSLSDVKSVGYSIITLEELRNQVTQRRMIEKVNISIYFITFMMIFVFGFINMTQMRIKQNEKKFKIIHALGISIHSIKKRFTAVLLFHTIVAFGASLIFLLGFQTVERKAYNRYVDLLTTQQELLGNTDFVTTGTWIQPELYELDKDTELYTMTLELQNLNHDWLLTHEMWMPNIWFGFFVCSGIVLVVILIISASLLGKMNMELYCGGNTNG